MARRRERQIKTVRSPRVNFSKEKKERIAKKFNYKCQLCPKDLTFLPKERVIDHKEPLSKGGSNKDYNLWLLCNDCDKKKKAEIIPEVIDDRIKQLEKKYPYLKKK